MGTHAGFTATPTELGWKKLSNIGEDGIDHHPPYANLLMLSVGDTLVAKDFIFWLYLTHFFHCIRISEILHISSEVTLNMELYCFRYEGLSDKFLSSPVPKLLLLAGTDRLDRLVHTNIMPLQILFLLLCLIAGKSLVADFVNMLPWKF